MGFFSELKNVLVPGGEPGLGLPSEGDVIKGFTGQLGAEASLEAARLQAGQQQKIFDLFAPQVQFGQAQLPALAESATAGGFGSNLGDIFSSGALDPIIAERQRASESALAARGLRRSGRAATEAAKIPTDLGLQVESELNRRRQAVAGIGETGIQGSAQALEGIGQSLAGGGLGAAQSLSQGSSNIGGLIGSLFSAFSDPSIKEDEVIIGQVGDLTVWGWNWKPGAPHGLEGRSSGFMADEVKKKYPEFVSMRDGLMVINYPGLLAELEGKHGYH